VNRSLCVSPLFWVASLCKDATVSAQGGTLSRQPRLGGEALSWIHDRSGAEAWSLSCQPVAQSCRQASAPAARPALCEALQSRLAYRRRLQGNGRCRWWSPGLLRRALRQLLSAANQPPSHKCCAVPGRKSAPERLPAETPGATADRGDSSWKQRGVQSLPKLICQGLWAT